MCIRTCIRVYTCARVCPVGPGMGGGRRSPRLGERNYCPGGLLFPQVPLRIRRGLPTDTHRPGGLLDPSYSSQDVSHSRHGTPNLPPESESLPKISEDTGVDVDRSKEKRRESDRRSWTTSWSVVTRAPSCSDPVGDHETGVFQRRV